MKRILTNQCLILSFIVLLAIILRIIAILIFDPDRPPEFDGILYDILASNILKLLRYEVDGNPTAFRAPVYPLFLAGIYFVSNHSYACVRFFQALLGGISAYIVFLIAQQIYHNNLIGYFAALGIAIYPFFIYLPIIFYSENLLIPLLLLLTYYLTKSIHHIEKRNYIISGILFGIIVLLRPNTHLFLPVLVLWGCLIYSPRRIEKITYLLIPFVIVILPWLIRNYIVFGGIIITTNPGVVIWQGNNDLSYQSGGRGIMPDDYTWPGEDDPDLGLGGWSYLSETESSKKFMNAGLDWIRNHPLEFISLIPKRIYQLWSPNYLGVRGMVEIPLVILGLYWLVMASALIISIYDRARWRYYLLFYLLILYFSLGAAVSFGATRHSLPLIFIPILWISFGINTMGQMLFPNQYSRIAKI